MLRMFDNRQAQLLPALKGTLQVSQRADCWVGYSNLRARTLIDEWPGSEGACCRLLVAIQSLPREELRNAPSLASHELQHVARRRSQFGHGTA